MKKNEYLLTKSTIHIDGNQDLKSDFNEIIRQQPNHKFLGFPIYLWAYNHIDSTKIAVNRNNYIKNLGTKNQRLLAKQKKINDRRIKHSIKKGKLDYKFKEVELKDTLNVKMSVKEWIKYRFGEAPVIFDSIYFEKSLDQLNVFLRKKGYYDATVLGDVKYVKKRNKVKTIYRISTGKVYRIDSISLISDNTVLNNLYLKFCNNPINRLNIHDHFDTDKLDNFRENLSRFVQINGVYGFSPSNIAFIADTNKRNKTVKLSIKFTDKVKKVNESDFEVVTPHVLTKVNKVYYHLIDSTYTKFSLKKRVNDLNISLLDNGYIRTLDTLYYINKKGVRHQLKQGIPEQKVDSINENRSVIITYNEKLFIDANLLEMQNLIEKNTYYNVENLEKSTNNLIELGLFQVVKPVIIENDDHIDVHYYLVPRKKMIYNSSARITTSGVFLGFSGSANYTNTNLFKGAEKLVLSFSIGLQSMPNLNYNTSSTTSDVADNAKQVFNTKEIGPSVKLEIPGIFPLSISSLNKNQRAKTLLATSFGFQQRNVFTRQSFKLNYIYNFIVGKNVELQFGFPGFSTINFINYLQFDETFKTSIYQNKDPFTQNYYRSQLNWQDFKFVYQYRNNDKKNADKKSIFFKSTFDLAGNLLSLFGNKSELSTENQKTILGISYSQFARLDNEFVYAYQISKFNLIILER
jgi:outer membrane protein insertion porin family